ncbi:hypothetical protein D3C81_1714800 [compost metagenome]
MLGQNPFDLLVLQRQWLALIGLLQSVDQCLDLQFGHLLAQAFAETRAQAVSEIVSLFFLVFFSGVGHGNYHAQR